jgi:hypothetical protein
MQEEGRVDQLRRRMLGAAAIMEGDANGAPHAPAAAYRSKFVGRYEHRLVSGGVGHNLPQEAPRAFATAVTDVAAAQTSKAS